MFEFVVSIGPCADNYIERGAEGELTNSRPVKEGCRLWLGEGDLCLLADCLTGRIEGLTGHLSPTGVCPTEMCVEPMEGSVTFSGVRRFEGAVYVGCNIRGTAADAEGGTVTIGDPSSADMAVRVAKNLVVCLKDGVICGVCVHDPDGRSAA